ncbi:sensor histidine kinase [Spirillospora sp. NBC_01491]|uniref:sensor histidine kinase n=1 Tax=Spirillospora sp. NBC_01491 TaxID=2976007 RepID=UPI002E3047C9|nr:sensor domain-containing protein [Spirillospora sp. NBC_01491]
MRPLPPRTPLEAVLRWRFLLSGWPWRSAGYLLTSVPAAALAAVPLTLIGLPLLIAAPMGGRATSLVQAAFLVAVGVLLIAGIGPLVAVPLAELERRRLGMIDLTPIGSGHRRPSGPGPLRWLRTRYAEPATWRELGYACLLVTVAPVLYAALALALLWLLACLVSPLLAQGGDGPVALGPATIGTPGDALPYALGALVLLPAVPYGLALIAGAHGLLARALLRRGSSELLRVELVELSRSRARLVDAFEAERRRIERDLHDGAQQRLIGLTLQIGLARLDVPPGSPAARSMDTAHAQAKRLMVELRELIHGIHPRVLTDRGLPAALGELADQAAPAVTVDAELPGRFPAHVEATAYFVVAEALTNAAKHGGAGRVRVTARWLDGLLTVEAEDDGTGGADPAGGTGLTGLADRVAVIDGRMFLSSPTGGPTVLRVELPCSLNRQPPSG